MARIMQDWLERAKATYKFHRAKCILDDSWTLTRTARSLRRSLGGVCEDIRVARFYKDHSSELEKFSYLKDALAHIRKREKEVDLSELDG